MDKEKELGYMEIREQICDVCHKNVAIRMGSCK